jgi:hypothetical protein
MARVRVCPNCGKLNAASSPFCGSDGCGFALTDVEIHESESVPPVNSENAPETQKDDSIDSRGTWRDDVQQVSPNVKVSLLFPWGEVTITESMSVGRDPQFSELASTLEDGGFKWVSGKHAELYVEGDTFYVRDLGSTNGTYVNERRLDNQPVRVADGDRISFSRRLVATVRMTS